MSPVQPRKTKQRTAIAELFEHADRPLSVDEVLAATSREVDGIGVATVYRAISALVESKWLDSVEIPGEPVRYERAGKDHHHHFQCESCQRVFDIPGCLESLTALVPATFRVKRHSVTLHGLCATCH
jgi:Fur family ferric uptake transcriptional regulator